MSTKWILSTMKQFGIDIKLTYKPMQADLHGHQIIYYIFYFNTTILFNISFIQFYFSNNLLLILDVPLRDIKWAGPLWAPINLGWADPSPAVGWSRRGRGPWPIEPGRSTSALFFRESNHFFNFFMFPNT